MIDAHLHSWLLGPAQPRWLTGPFKRDFPAEDAEAVLSAAGIDGAVLVQADDSAADTAHLLSLHAEHAWVLGVVGWLPIEDPAAVAAALALGTGLCGVRQLIHDDPRSGILDVPAVVESARMIAAAGIALDVPDSWPRDLASIGRLAERVPELTIVVDHLGKPPADHIADWAQTLARVAEYPNVVAKLSGLGRRPDLSRIVDTALNAFGAQRLMYGGDWPMTVPAGGYQAEFRGIRALIDTLGSAERTAIWEGTAKRSYRLAPRVM